ncbi:hypothetical protein [Diaphorobacter nitroreducens]|uniref:hypothetical protein n=1 Tax=Diaphorobacter nitroreducens TaxID=164759 RepID=UPI0000DC92FF|nr:hypothetical protein [Diaphorobacter nitroreducens]ABM41919.1 hypothetical protein Ajs_1729 [Acidovorax sp. JS42]
MSKLTHHHLTVEEVNDQHGPAIMLAQQEDGYDEPNTVLVHPWQLRAVCEHFGIVARDQQAAKTIATLQRRMAGLRDRIAALHDWMQQFSDHRHADLSHELTSIGALSELAREWCADFDGEQGATAVESNSTATECTSAPAAQASLL